MSFHLLTRKIYHRNLTKIIATLHPDWIDQDGHIEELLSAGATILRINLSHYDANLDGEHRKDEHLERWRAILERLATVRQKSGASFGIMIDTAGPEFRTRVQEPLELQRGDRIEIAFNESQSSRTDRLITVAVTPPEGFSGFGKLSGGAPHVVVIDDRNVEIRVDQVCNDRVEGEVVKVTQQGGDPYILSNRRKVSFPGMPIEAHPLSERDTSDISDFLDPDDSPVDYVAQSFVKSAGDLGLMRSRFPSSRNIKLIAKIETREALDPYALRGIVKKSDAIMIARGDLAAEVGFAKLSQYQREIISAAIRLRKPALVATGVYGTFSYHGHPSHAEVDAVCSAIEHGVAGFVLTNETTGEDPVPVVRALRDQVETEEDWIRKKGTLTPVRHSVRSDIEKRIAKKNLPSVTARLDTALSIACRAWDRNAKAAFIQTRTGSTVVDLDKCLIGIPVFALTNDPSVARTLSLFRGVYPVLFSVAGFGGSTPDISLTQQKELIYRASEDLNLSFDAQDVLIATIGHPAMEAGGTNNLSFFTWDHLLKFCGVPETAKRILRVLHALSVPVTQDGISRLLWIEKHRVASALVRLLHRRLVRKYSGGQWRASEHSDESGA
jgi:pyruvate kinase